MIWIDKIDGVQRHVDDEELNQALKDLDTIKRKFLEYDYLYAGNLNFEMFKLPYWEYLFLCGNIDVHKKNIIEEGALLYIYVLYKEIFESEGYCFLYKNKILFEILKVSINKYTPDSIKKELMVSKIKYEQQHYENERLSDDFSIDELSENEKNILDNLISNDDWVYSKFVLGI